MKRNDDIRTLCRKMVDYYHRIMFIDLYRRFLFNIIFITEYKLIPDR